MAVKGKLLLRSSANIFENKKSPKMEPNNNNEGEIIKTSKSDYNCIFLANSNLKMEKKRYLKGHQIGPVRSENVALGDFK